MYTWVFIYVYLNIDRLYCYATLKTFYDRGSRIELKPKNPFLPSIILNKNDIEIRGKFCGLISPTTSLVRKLRIWACKEAVYPPIFAILNGYNRSVNAVAETISSK